MVYRVACSNVGIPSVNQRSTSSDDAISSAAANISVLTLSCQESLDSTCFSLVSKRDNLIPRDMLYYSHAVSLRRGSVPAGVHEIAGDASATKKRDYWPVGR